MSESKVYYSSEIGWLEIVGTVKGIKSVLFVERNAAGDVEPVDLPPVMAEAVTQLDEYFRGERKEFSLKLAPEGTDFQQKVWAQLAKIPYGETASYLNVARAIGDPKAIRAVGAANGQNPIAIIIPCHRVVGSDGKLTGYGGGVWRKEWLLNHERRHSSGQLPLF
ncbi:MAG: methylated-DNA--[protein]-cysteine S-methyltransferase [Anaerolineae bacterium]|nr:methylated-DNA--[protein]-cysteine S-methyltransferase [Anaerolineae bacterium]